MSTTLVQHVLDETSKAPSVKVHAFLDRPAIGVVQIGPDFAIQSHDPERLYALADAALKVAKDLQQQIADDAAKKAARDAAPCPCGHNSAKAS